ncbi:MAG: DoxX family protein [Acetobacteraceae bacterium]|nr:DoxX family protein [Acetobacteraceae bacterium]
MRIVAGLCFLEHGTAKLFGFPADPRYQQGHLSPLMLLAGVLEALGGVLITLGWFTRPVAFLLSGEMAVAYFMAHAPRSVFPAINGGDAAILYCFIFLYLAVAGGGLLSVDRLAGPGRRAFGRRAAA